MCRFEINLGIASKFVACPTVVSVVPYSGAVCSWGRSGGCFTNGKRISVVKKSLLQHQRHCFSNVSICSSGSFLWKDRRPPNKWQKSGVSSEKWPFLARNNQTFDFPLLPLVEFRFCHYSNFSTRSECQRLMPHLVQQYEEARSKISKWSSKDTAGANTQGISLSVIQDPSWIIINWMAQKRSFRMQWFW